MKRAFKDISEIIHQTDPTASFAIKFWDGDSIKIGDKPKFILKFKSLRGAKKIIRDGYLGFGESYMKGDVEIENDLQELLRLGFLINFDEFRLSSWQKIRFFILALLNSDTLRTAPKNISYHYDKGNEFYSLYLDKTMTYSCAYYKSKDDSLEEAQLNKYEHVCRKLLLSPGESLLDIGCGWGGMLIYAAQKYGITGVGNTLSQNQYEYAGNKIKELGLEDKIKILYMDYRELSGKFDKIVSIGMFEHVGKKFIPIFLKKVSSLLKKGSLGLLHTIGKDTPSPIELWTSNYIFPGIYVPSLDEILREMGKNSFSILDVENLRLHYAKTLDQWAENYEKNIEKVKKMFDDIFVRQWRLFLYGNSAGFKYGMSRLYQVLFTKGLNNTLPTTRSHVYNNL
jgi:cyclopropane-fatty-acyl-phospholipid synthase